MESFLGSISSLWQSVTDVFYMVYDYLFNLVGRLDSISFTTNSLVFRFFGLLRYFLGDTIYFAVMTVIIIGASFLLYKLFKKAFNFLISIIPGISGGSI